MTRFREHVASVALVIAGSALIYSAMYLAASISQQ